MNFLYPYDLALILALLILALFVLIPCFLSKRCIFHKWEYSGVNFKTSLDTIHNFRRCSKCKRKQYTVITDSGITSIWFDLH